ncbi:MAG: translation initiation factor IF-2 [Bacteroidales bacterium]|nr:translation initiation factor IF-2 [Bacteroidales bacterium]
MTATRKDKRLRKVAGEFNIGTSTIVDFLSDKGFKIDSSPNSKITPEMYDLLNGSFQSDKSLKEQKEAVTHEFSSTRRAEKEKAAIEVAEKEAAEEAARVAMAAEKAAEKAAEAAAEQARKAEEEKKAANVIKTEIPKPKVIGNIDLDAGKKKTKKAEKTEKVEKEEKAKKTEKVEEPKEEKIELVEKKVAVETQAEVVKEVASAPETDNVKKGPKILGTVDLKGMNQKTRPDKKSKKEKKNEIKVHEKKKPNKQEGKNEAPAKPEQAKEAVVDTKPKDDPNFVKTRIEKLAGPTVLGKIELPVIKKPEKKKPIGSSSDNPNKKKKRKRIRKDGGKPANTNTNSNQRQNAKESRFKSKKKKREPKPELSEEDISKQIKETLARLNDSSKKTSVKHRRNKRDTVGKAQMAEIEKQEEEKSTIKVAEFVTANELATMMSISVNDVIATCMSLGLFVSINQRLDAETIVIVAEEFGYTVDFLNVKEVEDTELDDIDDEADLIPRNPIVTVMGHVDHGKTSLLDFIRSENVIAGEAGGITQHIGAYEVELKSGQRISFLDTPGHEAFTAMRARGSKITDVAVIVIAADDSIMPQTKESINHAQAADVPIIFAINKIDKPGANPEKIKEELANMNLLVEDWGGKIQSQEISAKNGTGVEELMEKIVLEAEMLDLKANPNRSANGTVLEASLDKGKGYVTKILVQNGTLKVGDMVLAGMSYGKVKAMFNERNKLVETAGPATPVLLLGLNSAPQAGDAFRIYRDEKEVKAIASKREQLQREQGVRTQKHITLDEIGRRLAIGDFKELNLIVKGDVDGSIEALSDALVKLSVDEIQVNIIHKSVGQVNEADVVLASASDAIIIAFQVRPSPIARQLADKEQIDIRTYSVIYKAIDEIKEAMQGMLSPDMVEEIVCSVEVRDVFKITKVGTVAGCYVLDGKINRNTKIRLIRDGIVIYEGGLGSLKRFKDDAKEVAKGYECGLNIENYNDIKVNDIIEGFEMKEVERKL